LYRNWYKREQEKKTRTENIWMASSAIAYQENARTVPVTNDSVTKQIHTSRQYNCKALSREDRNGLLFPNKTKQTQIENKLPFSLLLETQRLWYDTSLLEAL